MSEVKVNKISPRTNCGTVQLGDSGDTITIPAGATITNNGTASGFGATGSASWVTGSIKTATFTATAGEGYFCNTSGGVFTVNLPSSPSAGAVVAVADYANTFDTNNLTIGRGGSNIEGAAADFLVNTEGVAVTLVYVDATKGWIVTDTGNSTDASAPRYVTATGGTITTCGDFKIHKFTGPGTFQVTCAGNACGSSKVDYLVVAGGGGGGGECGSFGGAAGGGAGGLRIGAVSPSGCHSPLVAVGGLAVTATSFPITVGGGGTAGPQTAPGNGGNGVNSVFSTITSAGGGGGGKSVGPGSTGNNGGSGGGGRCTAGSGNTPPVSPPQGNPGGGPGPQNVGGGGATAAGAAVPGCGGNSGGAGLQVTPVFGAAPKSYYIANGPDNGASVCGQFAGGGAGGHDIPRPGTSNGGVGGGANVPGGSGNGLAGTTNTGGGGSGGGRDVPQPGPGVGGAGGSGIVLIRYKFQN